LPALAVQFLISTTSLFAQSPPSPSIDAPTPFARYVPADAGVFVSVERLDEVASALSKAHADRILALLTGIDAGRLPSLDPRTLVAAFSGSAARIEDDELRSSGFGVAASSGQDLLEGVLFVRTPAAQTIERWFPQGRSARISPSTRVIRIDDNIVACARDDVVALARSSGSGTFMRDTLRLMAGRTSDGLVGSEDFRELAHYLPARPIAMAYITQPSKPGPAAAPIATNEGLAPASAPSTQPEARSALQDIVVGMYDRAGRLDFAVRGTREFAGQRRPLSESAIAKVKSLPQGTVFVWLATHELDELLRGDVDVSDNVLGRYVRLFAGLRERNGQADPIPPLGQHLILALDRDSDAERQTPQVLAMIDTPEPRAVAEEFSDAVDAFLDLLYSVDTVSEDDAPVIQVWTHAGTPISSVPLDRYASASRFRGAALVRSLAPSWAATSDWFIVTSTKEEMVRVLDAMAGTAPTLGEIASARVLFDQSTKRNSLAFVQGSALADLLVRWLRDAEKGYPSILNRTTLAKGALASGPRPEELGVSLREPATQGQVIVESVLPGSTADGQLLPQDRIVAIDGRVLNLALPSQDLRRQLASTALERRTLRVLRGEEGLDVTLATPTVAVNLPAIPLDPGAATRELALIIREIDFASFSELQAQPEHYAALVSVRFTPVQPPAPSTVEPPPSVVETSRPDQAD
jgi:hypothetical protein